MTWTHVGNCKDVSLKVICKKNLPYVRKIFHMILHDYLEQVLGNKGSISVLRALVGHKGKVFTIRLLAEDAGISHTEAASTVNDLENLGIVQVQPVGKAHQVSLNKKSYVLNKIVEQIFKAEQHSLQEVIMILKKNLNSKKIISAVIFGSVARREEKEDSDIDLLIISNDYDQAIESVSRIAEEISLMFHTKVSHVIFSEKQLRSKKNSDLIRSIIKDHVLITGKELADMIK
ncbi:MAG TPA: nucleotidyltransferase domain-containing protein [Candidatus Nitrosotenuis sp.]